MASSIAPSQSLSFPSQTSIDGSVNGTPSRPDPEHINTPGEQTPGTPVEHVPPPWAAPSSTLPLQSSSTPSHVSAVGVTSPEQGPHAPPWHACVPSLHAPTPLVDGGPE